MTAGNQVQNRPPTNEKKEETKLLLLVRITGSCFVTDSASTTCDGTAILISDKLLPKQLFPPPSKLKSIESTFIALVTQSSTVLVASVYCPNQSFDFHGSIRIQSSCASQSCSSGKSWFLIIGGNLSLGINPERGKSPALSDNLGFLCQLSPLQPGPPHFKQRLLPLLSRPLPDQQ